MKDNYSEFSVSLNDIIRCLYIAEKNGYVPMISQDLVYVKCNNDETPKNLANLINNEGFWCNCEHCNGDYMFVFKDSSHKIHISLEMVLQCLKSAENIGAIGRLGSNFWFLLETRYYVQSWE